MLQSDNYEVQFICSEYSSATDECNAQLDAIQKIVKKYSPESMVIGEAPLMKDLQDTTNVDLQRVNILSMAKNIPDHPVCIQINLVTIYSAVCYRICNFC